MKLDNRVTALVAVVLALAIGAGAWFLGVSPQLAAASTSAQRIADTEDRNADLQRQVTSLTADEAKMATYTDSLAALTRSVPATANVSDLLRGVGSMADSTGVILSSFTPSEPVAYQPPANDTSAPVADTGDAPAASPSPTAEPASTSPLEQINAQVTPANFQLIPLTISVKGSEENVLRFLDAVRNGSRLITVTQVSESSDDGGGKTLTLVGSAFVYQSGTTAAANG